MAKLATGAGLAKGLGLITAPIITRIYLPEHFAVLSVFAALSGLLVPFSAMKYSLAIPLPKSDATATNVLMIALSILMLVTMISFLLFAVFGSSVFHFLSMEELLPYWYLLPIAVAGIGLYELLTNWAVRAKSFTVLAKTKVWQKLLGAALKIGLGFAGLKPAGLLIGQVFSQAGGVVSLFRSFKKSIVSNWRHVTKKRMTFLFYRFSSFPKYRLPAQFLLVLSAKLPLLFFARYFGSEATGPLGLTLTMLALPISLFGQSTGQAFYSEVAKIGRKNPKSIRRLTGKIAVKLFLFSFIPFIILLFLGPSLFSFVFGDPWREAGVYASALALYLLVQFIYSPIGSAIFNVFDKQSIVLWINISRVILIAGAFYFAFLTKLTPFHTLILYSIAISVQYVLATFIVFYTIKKA